MGIGYDIVCMDNWDSFLSVFQHDNYIIGKESRGIEGNNCCFLKHFKAFDLAFFYIIFSFV